MNIIQSVPTNIITGFLGSGKTTLITHLLQHKPAGERWAVLINEFGSAGVDGSLLSGTQADDGQVFIKEVPGGCLCCAAGLPAQIAINSLLARARPQRLLIEPTGLGHPREILELLQSEHYRSVIDLRATLTLVDARKASDPRYTRHETFRQQLEVADVIIASKADLYSGADREQLQNMLSDMNCAAANRVVESVQGDIPLALLEAPARAAASSNNNRLNALSTMLSSTPAADIGPAPLFPAAGYLTSSNRGDGFVSYAWVFSPDKTFRFRPVLSLLSSVRAERLKAVLITDQGVIGYNCADDVSTELVLDDAADSRIEIILADGCANPVTDEALLACLSH